MATVIWLCFFVTAVVAFFLSNTKKAICNVLVRTPLLFTNTTVTHHRCFALRCYKAHIVCFFSIYTYHICTAYIKHGRISFYESDKIHACKHHAKFMFVNCEHTGFFLFRARSVQTPTKHNGVLCSMHCKLKMSTPTFAYIECNHHRISREIRTKNKYYCSLCMFDAYRHHCRFNKGRARLL